MRALLSDERIAKTLDGVILLDGLHTSYIPERAVIAEGGVLDTLKLEPFLRYARRAVAGDARFISRTRRFSRNLRQHDRDFGLADQGAWPRAYSSAGVGTRWMQQTSEVRRGRLQILAMRATRAPINRPPARPRRCPARMDR